MSIKLLNLVLAQPIARIITSENITTGLYIILYITSAYYKVDPVINQKKLDRSSLAYRVYSQKNGFSPIDVLVFFMWGRIRIVILFKYVDVFWNGDIVIFETSKVVIEQGRWYFSSLHFAIWLRTSAWAYLNEHHQSSSPHFDETVAVGLKAVPVLGELKQCLLFHRSYSNKCAIFPIRWVWWNISFYLDNDICYLRLK